MYLRLSIQARHPQRLSKFSVRYPMDHQITGGHLIESVYVFHLNDSF